MLHYKATFLILFYLIWQPLSATSLQNDIPEVLTPWIPWVMEGEENSHCPHPWNQSNPHHCLWPSSLTLSVDHQQGHFEQHWQVLADGWVPLVGDKHVWPSEVKVNDYRWPVSRKQHKPAVFLTAGSYRIQGKLSWSRLPNRLSIPNGTALVKLTRHGKTVPAEIQKNTLWLQQPPTSENSPTPSQTEHITLRVFRKITDTRPLQIHTEIQLSVSGKARQQTLGHALLPGFSLLTLNSTLPVQVTPQGQLSAQLKAGQWRINLTLRQHQRNDHLLLPKQENNFWPTEETWSFEAQPQLRHIQIRSTDENHPLQVTDPQQTRMPNRWHKYPAWLIAHDQGLHLHEKDLQAPTTLNNSLNLTRLWWLDFDGQGYTVQDRIKGKLHTPTRLLSIPPLKPGRAELNGHPQLITQLNKQPAGIALPPGSISLTADSRLETLTSNTLNVSDWQHDFDSAEARLMLPPGWILLWTSGVDQVQKDWLRQWSLLDLFMVLLISLSFYRLWHWGWGLIALPGLILSWHLQGAPHFLWMYTLALVALARLLPTGKLETLIRASRNLLLLALTISLLLFAAQQLRLVLHPQLEHPYTAQTDFQHYPINAEQKFSPNMTKEILQTPNAMMKRAKSFRLESGLAKQQQQQQQQQQQHSSLKVQTGPGIPSWNWTTIRLKWHGIITPEAQLQLTLLPPTATRLLRLTGILLLLFLMAPLLIPKRLFSKKAFLNNIGPLMLIGFISGWPATEAEATDFPSPQLLQELKDRLLKGPDCLPTCASLNTLDIQITDTDQITLNMDIHALTDSMTPLPVNPQNWLPESVMHNTQSAALKRFDKKLWISLEKGIQSVVLHGSLAQRQTLNIPLPLSPGQVTYKISSAWQLSGLRDGRATTPSLQLIRKKQPKTQTDTLTTTEISPFIRVTRTLQLHNDWQLTTTVQRLSQLGTPIYLKLPLVTGESLLDNRFKQNDQLLSISLNAQQQQIQWQSLLPQTSSLHLTAPNASQNFTEVWELSTSPLWHVTTKGLEASRSENTKLTRWHPQEGDTLTLSISQPQNSAGQTRTIDHSELIITPGQHLTTYQLTLNIRSSLGDEQHITFPLGTELQSITRNGQTLNLPLDNQQVTLPVLPDNQSFILRWRQKITLGSIHNTPVIDLGIPSINHQTQLKLPNDRWLLFSHGPLLGPAVLIWGTIFFILVLSVPLARWSYTPLTKRHWILLGIGLSQGSIGGTVVVILWLLLMGQRQKHSTILPHQKWRFNLGQIVLFCFTLAACFSLFQAITQGLLGAPSMQISGNGSTAKQLIWYQDRIGSQLPTVWTLSVPLFIYRLLMLAWALWLSFALLRWLQWSWTCWSSGGIWQAFSWRKKTP